MTTTTTMITESETIKAIRDAQEFDFWSEGMEFWIRMARQSLVEGDEAGVKYAICHAMRCARAMEDY